jgi:hypothetical protein
LQLPSTTKPSSPREAATIIDDTNTVVGAGRVGGSIEEIVGEFGDETDRPAS